jgi:hypothetical protein
MYSLLVRLADCPAVAVIPHSSTANEIALAVLQLKTICNLPRGSAKSLAIAYPEDGDVTLIYVNGPEVASGAV